MKIGMNHWPWRNSANAGLNSFRMRLELAEISKKTQNRHFLATLLAYKICMRAPKLVVPDQGENCRRRSWRHEETIDIGCIAQSVTHQEMTKKKTVPKSYFKQVAMRTSGIIAMPRSLLRVWIWKFNFDLVRIWSACTNARKACPPFDFWDRLGGYYW